MKFVVLAFGSLGFAIVAVAGFSADRQPDLILRDAALGCLATAAVGRWFWRVIERGFSDTLSHRRQAAADAASAEAAAKQNQPAKAEKTASARPLSSAKPAAASR